MSSVIYFVASDVILSICQAANQYGSDNCKKFFHITKFVIVLYKFGISVVISVMTNYTNRHVTDILHSFSLDDFAGNYCQEFGVLF